MVLSKIFLPGDGWADGQAGWRVGGLAGWWVLHFSAVCGGCGELFQKSSPHCTIQVLMCRTPHGLKNKKRPKNGLNMRILRRKTEFTQLSVRHNPPPYPESGEQFTKSSPHRQKSAKMCRTLVPEKHMLRQSADWPPACQGFMSHPVCLPPAPPHSCPARGPQGLPLPEALFG